jgi:hypothetical protein
MQGKAQMESASSSMGGQWGMGIKVKGVCIQLHLANTKGACRRRAEAGKHVTGDKTVSSAGHSVTGAIETHRHEARHLLLSQGVGPSKPSPNINPYPNPKRVPQLAHKESICYSYVKICYNRDIQPLWFYVN